jgi:hypothetical protein
MRVKKNTAPVETKLDLTAARFEIYNADAASDPPNHARVIVTVPGKPDGVRVDMPLGDLLTKKARENLEQYRLELAQAALAREGFAEEPEAP